MILPPNPSPEVLADGHLAVGAGCHRATGWWHPMKRSLRKL